MSLKICDKINKPSGRMDMDCMLENTKQCRHRERRPPYTTGLKIYTDASGGEFAGAEGLLDIMCPQTFSSV